jgi:hypothetical protein
VLAASMSATAADSDLWSMRGRPAMCWSPLCFVRASDFAMRAMLRVRSQPSTGATRGAPGAMGAAPIDSSQDPIKLALFKLLPHSGGSDAAQACAFRTITRNRGVYDEWNLESPIGRHQRHD